MEKLYFKQMMEKPSDPHIGYLMRNNGLEKISPESQEFEETCFQYGLVKILDDITYFRPGLNNEFPDHELGPKLAEKGWEYQPPE